MKLIKCAVIVLLVLITINACQSKKDYDSVRASLVADEDFKNYLSASMSDYGALNNTTTGNSPIPMKDMSEVEIIKRMDRNRLSIFQKIHQKYIASNLLTSEQLKTILEGERSLVIRK